MTFMDENEEIERSMRRMLKGERNKLINECRDMQRESTGYLSLLLRTAEHTLKTLTWLQKGAYPEED